MLSIHPGLVAQDQTNQAKPATRASGQAPDSAFLAAFHEAEGKAAPPKGEKIEIDTNDPDLPEAPLDTDEALDDPVEGDTPSAAKAKGSDEPSIFAVTSAPNRDAEIAGEVRTSDPGHGSDGAHIVTPQRLEAATGTTPVPAHMLTGERQVPAAGPPAAEANAAVLPNAGKMPDAGTPLQLLLDDKQALTRQKTAHIPGFASTLEQPENRTATALQGTRAPDVRTGLIVPPGSAFPAAVQPEPQHKAQASAALQTATPQAASNEFAAQPLLSANTPKPMTPPSGIGHVQSSKPELAPDRGDHRQPSLPPPPTVAPQAGLASQPGSNASPPVTAPMTMLGSLAPKPEMPEEVGRGAPALDGVTPDLRPSGDAAMRPGAVPSHALQAPDLPRHIAQQILDALQRAGGGGERGVDLMLNPAELGRVRISLSPGDAGLTVQIIADRPETLDLMRRNIDLLAQDFQNIGYDATDFAFAQHQGDREHQGQGGPAQDNPHTPEAQDPSVHGNPTILMDRVDIRL
jgi:flagellar hook-length control protein FliK